MATRAAIKKHHAEGMYPAKESYHKVSRDMNEPGNQREDQKLWRRFVADSASSTSPDPSDLDAELWAAYLDGRASRQEVEAIEQHLASHPSELDALIELRGLQETGDAYAVVPASLLTAAKQIGPFSERVGGGGGSVEVGVSSGRRWEMTTRWRWVQWPVAALLMLSTGLVGYAAGQGTYSGDRAAAVVVSDGAALFDDFGDDESLLEVAVRTGGGR